jgi:hypothetical protein
MSAMAKRDINMQVSAIESQLLINLRMLPVGDMSLLLNFSGSRVTAEKAEKQKFHVGGAA